MSGQFTGDKHAPMKSPLARAERRFIDWMAARWPRAIRSQHLTMMTLGWSAGVVLAGWLAGRGSLHWLWLGSAMLVAQWFTDSMDGTVGKMMGEGLRRWGYFMDHFLDYVFMACAMGVYAFVVPEPARTWFLLLVPLYGAFEVNSWLQYGATGEFHITYGHVGPTEIRLGLIAVNTGVIVFGTGWLAAGVPWFILFDVVVLTYVVWQTQKGIWAMDMREKAELARKHEDGKDAS